MSNIIPGEHSLLIRTPKNIIPGDESAKLLNLERVLEILSGNHTLLSTVPPSVGYHIIAGNHERLQTPVPYLWLHVPAISIRGCINRKGWKQDGKTVTHFYSPFTRRDESCIRDYSTCILTPEFKAYTTKLRAAATAWQLLTESEKIKYRKRAIGRPLYGYNLFVREYFKTH